MALVFHLAVGKVPSRKLFLWLPRIYRVMFLLFTKAELVKSYNMCYVVYEVGCTIVLHTVSAVTF